MKLRYCLYIIFAVSISGCSEGTKDKNHQHQAIENKNTNIYPIENIDLLKSSETFGNIFYQSDIEKNKVQRVIDSINYTESFLNRDSPRYCKENKLDIFIISSERINDNELLGVDRSTRDLRLNPVIGLYQTKINQNSSMIFISSDLGLPLIGRTSIHEYYHHFQSMTCKKSQDLELEADSFSNLICKDSKLCENY